MEQLQTVSLGYAQFWLFITAVIFTVLGFSWGFSVKTRLAAGHVIDTLIKEGYLKTRLDEKGETQLLKYWEDEKNE